ncbi:MAG: gamma-glutamylcyclotransferase [Phycisphaerae bacterium]|nr:gamma-glutamylcyclotransferase [Phycisphaerae bacterium]
MQNQNFTANLFVYGSLRDPDILRSVCGYGFTLTSEVSDSRTLRAESAILPYHRRLSPDNVYCYAVPDPDARIEGFIIFDLPVSALAEIDRYEGKYYTRETVKVNTSRGLTEAQAYLVSRTKMQKRFGDRFYVNLIHELWLRKRIDRFFEMHTRPGEQSPDATIERRARRELMATTERDLLAVQMDQSSVSDYFIEREFDRPCPSIRECKSEPQSRPYLDNYLTLLVKLVLLNQIEQQVQSRYRYEMERLATSARYFNRSISMLIALRMINVNQSVVDMIQRRCLETMSPEGPYDLIDYVKFAITAADNLFDERVVTSMIEWVRTNRQPGLIPLGTELEFSNLGFRAVSRNPADRDPDFNGFLYFNDFCLDVLSWKLGGYVDDHTGRSCARRQGFLEMAPGRLNIVGELSKPATNDPWILNHLIREIAAFMPIKPHSLHLSFQIRKRHMLNDKVLPLSFVKCLLAMGGGIQEDAQGRVWVSRMQHDEIEQNVYGQELVFARRSKRKFHISADDIAVDRPASYATTYVQQYKFIRLDSRANYEAMIMALKGLQILYHPADYLTAEQLAHSAALRAQYRKLKDWSRNPSPLSHRTIGRFIDAIRKGLLRECHGKPAHKLHYIDWVLGAIDVQLRMFNKVVESQPEKKAPNDLRLIVDALDAKTHPEDNMNP